MNKYCLNLLKHTKYIIIQRLECRFHLVQFFTTRTMIAQQLEDSVPEHIKRAKMQYRNTIASKVKITLTMS